MNEYSLIIRDFCYYLNNLIKYTLKKEFDGRSVTKSKRGK